MMSSEEGTTLVADGGIEENQVIPRKVGEAISSSVAAVASVAQYPIGENLVYSQLGNMNKVV